MKATGIVRRVDDLGRIVIPKEIRNSLRIPVLQPMEIFTGDNGEIILRKYVVACSECGESKEELLGNTKICRECATKLSTAIL